MALVAKAKTKKSMSPRAERRERGRVMSKDIEARQKLARMEAGGAPERPIEVTSASLVEVLAASVQCPLCGARLRIEEHAAVTIERARLRVVRAVCTQCSAPRSLYFRISASLPN